MWVLSAATAESFPSLFRKILELLHSCRRQVLSFRYLSPSRPTFGVSIGSYQPRARRMASTNSQVPSGRSNSQSRRVQKSPNPSKKDKVRQGKLIRCWTDAEVSRQQHFRRNKSLTCS